jgi:RecA/RadA recombinase
MKFPIPELNQHFNSIDTLKGIFSVFGDFGVGKTIFSIQTAINSAKLGKNIIYIYTKPNIPSERILLTINKSKEILDNILFIQITDFSELYKIIFNFEFLILDNLKKKKIISNLIVIDSITHLYRIELNQDKKELNYNLNYQLNQILANLFFLNEIYKIEILIVNEISRKMVNDQIVEVQSGGKVMEYWANYTLKIAKTKKLNERKLIFNEVSENLTFKCVTNLTQKGFE